ncbi:TSUP family transporter [Parasphaerochaeta coccoides]|uniref:Probable membrane transporter protein n=1 Tax=Parasphaerochaeta coccoides (strain ATCC BAA-1237 / DSM 17374 / SPN1) TaxID=760011 RepID=F4GIW3_PARC1|nr:TSUP family transporter [Parasphaerochaeta coccoides]AEC02731.1 protein of unknown function DUF81 [Parasphaerochaeta coccoides DSM 17374]
MLSLGGFLLIFLIFMAGLVDSIAGGGGLISLAAYSVFGLPPHLALGTNKFASCSGTTVAALRYIRAKDVVWRTALSAALCSGLGSLVGARLVLTVEPRIVSILMLVLTPVLAVFTLVNKNLGKASRDIPASRALVMSLVLGLAVGCYDGFFGPGSGMFLTLGFTALVGLEIEKACGNTKIVNLASNIGALTIFIINGQVDYAVAIPCALASIAGNYVGSGLAIRNGIKIVRPFFIVVLSLLFVTLALDWK